MIILQMNNVSNVDSIQNPTKLSSNPRGPSILPSVIPILGTVNPSINPSANSSNNTKRNGSVLETLPPLTNVRNSSLPKPVTLPKLPPINIIPTGPVPPDLPTVPSRRNGTAIATSIRSPRNLSPKNLSPRNMNPRSPVRNSGTDNITIPTVINHQTSVNSKPEPVTKDNLPTHKSPIKETQPIRETQNLPTQNLPTQKSPIRETQPIREKSPRDTTPIIIEGEIISRDDIPPILHREKLYTIPTIPPENSIIPQTTGKVVELPKRNQSKLRSETRKEESEPETRREESEVETRREESETHREESETRREESDDNSIETEDEKQESLLNREEVMSPLISAASPEIDVSEYPSDNVILYDKIFFVDSSPIKSLPIKNSPKNSPKDKKSENISKQSPTTKSSIIKLSPQRTFEDPIIETIEEIPFLPSDTTVSPNIPTPTVPTVSTINNPTVSSNSPVPTINNPTVNNPTKNEDPIPIPSNYVVRPIQNRVKIEIVESPRSVPINTDSISETQQANRETPGSNNQTNNQTNNRPIQRTPRSNNQQTQRTPRSNNQPTQRTPRSNNQQTPRSNNQTNRSNNRPNSRSANESSKRAEYRSENRSETRKPRSQTRPQNRPQNRTQIKPRPPPIFQTIPMPNYEAMKPSEQARWHTDYDIKFAKLRKLFPDYNIPYFDSSVNLEIKHRNYERYLQQVQIDRGTSRWKGYLLFFLGLIEIICVKGLGLDMSGFFFDQISTMISYESMLMELGEKSQTSFGASWPVEIRIVLLSLVNAIIFVGIRLFSSHFGAGLANIIKQMIKAVMNNKDPSEFVRQGQKIQSGDSESPAEEKPTNEPIHEVPDVPETGGWGDIGGLFNTFAGFMGGNNDNGQTRPRAPRRATYPE